MKPKALFIGRWQPMHNGHKWLIDQKLLTGTPVLIAIRDILPDDKNPFTTEQTAEMIRKIYVDKDVEVIIIPNIESVNYGRGVGYEINEFSPPEEIGAISATFIRSGIKSNDDRWKLSVDKIIHKEVVKYMKENGFL